MDLLAFHDEKALAGGKRLLSPRSLIEMAAQLGHLDAMNLLVQAKTFKDQAEKEKAEEEERGALFGPGRGGVDVS